MFSRPMVKCAGGSIFVGLYGGQFERLIGLFKRAFYKVIGNSTLSWKGLTEVVLNVEVALNNRPLSYIEDDIGLPLAHTR